MSNICIVIPCYNEETRFDKHHFDSYLASNELGVHFILVNDGSLDGTSKLIHSLKSSHPSNVDVLDLKINVGKAEAVRQGILKAMSNSFDFVGFWDADFSAPLKEIDHVFGAFLKNDKLAFALGSRVKRMGSQIERETMRHYMGRLFSTFSSQVVQLPVYDSQCGAKIFKSSKTSFLFETAFVSKWLFDVEILVRYRLKNGTEAALTEIIEVPLNVWREVAGSKLKMSDFLKVPMELMNIHRTYNK